MASRVTACLWCGAPLEDPRLRLRGRVRCPECGSQTTDPMPSLEDLAQAYGNWYRPDAGRFSGLGDALLRRLRSRNAIRFDQIAPPGTILDVGCGDGTLLDALQARGRKAIGLERESSRDDVLDKDLSELEGEDQYAGIILWHALEHLPDPAGAVRHAHRLLAPGGVIVIAVPNIASPQARIFGDDWLALDLPRHLIHLSDRALGDGLREAGFEIRDTSPAKGGQVLFGWLYGLVRKLPGRLDLYDALRKPEARSAPMTNGQRLLALALATLMLPVALVGTAYEYATGRSGTIYVEAAVPAVGAADPS